MAVKGTNHRTRKARLTRAYLDAYNHLGMVRLSDDAAAAQRWNERMRLTRLAWQRLDDHLYPKRSR